MTGKNLTPRQKAVFGAIERAARAGDTCPTNEMLCGIIEASSVSSPTNVVAQLERLGLIKVQRFQRSRIVTIVATGKQTAGIADRPHWRDGTGALSADRPKRGYRKSDAKFRDSNSRPEIPPEALPEQIPAIETCFKCGVRSDVGCEHRVTDADELTPYDMARFDDALSDGLSLVEIAARLHWTARTVAIAFERVTRELGAQAA